MEAYLPLPKQHLPVPDGVCHVPTSDDIEVLGSGGYGRLNLHGGWYNAYWCEKCKRMYVEHFSEHRVHYTYSPKETKAHMKAQKTGGITHD